MSNVCVKNGSFLYEMKHKNERNSEIELVLPLVLGKNDFDVHSFLQIECHLFSFRAVTLMYSFLRWNDLLFPVQYYCLLLTFF